MAWGITREGHRVLLHLMLGNKESYENWRDLLRDMVRRGLDVLLVITSDGVPGLIRAIEHMGSRSLRERCLVHKIRNIVAKLPSEAVPEVKAHLEAVFRHARPRPTVPYYPQLSDILQRHLNAALAGQKPSAQALAEAQAEITPLVQRYTPGTNAPTDHRDH